MRNHVSYLNTIGSILRTHIAYKILILLLFASLATFCGCNKKPLQDITFAVGGAPAELDFWQELTAEFETQTGSDTVVYTIGHDILSQASGTSNPVYLLYDGHGSVRHLADNAGDLITGQEFHYDAFGNLLGSPAPATNLLYSGEWRDFDIDLDYLRSRWLDPLTARFITMDTFCGNNRSPQSLHKYLYVHNNPINAADPTGDMFVASVVSVGNIMSMLSALQIGSQHMFDLNRVSRLIIKQNFDTCYKKQTDGWWIVLPRCPCRITVKDGTPSFDSEIDKNYWEEPNKPSGPEERLHPGIKFSMRSKVNFNHTNQCTYKADGTLYLKDEYPMAGTVDWRRPISSEGGGLGIAHLEADVYPLHWAVFLDHGIKMHVFWGPKTPSPPDYPIGKYMKKYYEKRPLYAKKECGGE